MKTTDLRDLTWKAVQNKIVGHRLAVLNTWREHGPGTTYTMAARAGISILTFRPRTTELCQLGLLTLVGRQGTEGIYRAVPADEAQAAFEAAQRAAAPEGHQVPLAL